LAATPVDMAAYARMLLNRGQGPRGRILSKESFALMSQPVIDMQGEEWYGYGLMIDDVEGHRYLGHEGGMIGYLSTIWADMDAGLGVVVLMNGPGDPDAIAHYALLAIRAAQEHQDMPAPPTVDAAHVPNAADYVGAYTSKEKSFTLVAEGERLLLAQGAARLPLERAGPDRFSVNHPEYALFWLTFGRDHGQVVEAFHGPDWYVNQRYAGPSHFAYPPEWEAYPGHYRTHNPWLSNFRVVLRKGNLILTFPTNPQGFSAERTLTACGDGNFQCSAGMLVPGRIRFDTVLDGRALRATLAGCAYYHVFTP
jgi:hypothetical protein